MSDRKLDFEKALTRRYKAIMFDMDGTLTEPGHHEIPDDLMAKIGSLSTTLPMAICSGRRFEGILDKIQPFMDAAPDQALARKNWHLFLENGSIGIRYDVEKGEYDRFYQIDWPEEKISIQAVFEEIQKRAPKIDECDMRINECSIGVYPLHRGEYSKQKLAGITAELAQMTNEFLNDFDGRETVHVIDSGVAIHVIPTNGDKDRGIKEFADILRNNWGMDLDEDARDILIVGDQPNKGCNDEKFLEGKCGTPFTAEHVVDGRLYPIPVFENGVVLKGPSATLSLLNQIKFA
jgi:hydroxymethylpyrimidine pyrophosphatase-like HAD family hydrolase